MITSGWNGSTEMDSTEVIDLTTGKTFNMPSLGRKSVGATGGLLAGLPLVCGGGKDRQIHSMNKKESKSLGHSFDCHKKICCQCRTQQQHTLGHRRQRSVIQSCQDL